MSNTKQFPVGSFVTDLSGIKGEVIENPNNTPLIRVAFGPNGTIWRDLQAKHLTPVPTSNTKHTQETETKPLWRVLNEQRTQGNWDSNELHLFSTETGLRITEFNIWSAKVEKEPKINAQYTALAVNNLHHLAQALQDLLNEVKLGKLNIRKDFSLINAHAQASKALSRIS